MASHKVISDGFVEVWEIEEAKSLTVLLLCLKTYENLRFLEIEKPKALTVLLLGLKIYENLGSLEIEEPKALTV